MDTVDHYMDSPPQNLPNYNLESRIIIDNGTGQIKCGFSNSNPRIVASAVGRPKVPRIMLNSQDIDFYVGEVLKRDRGILSLSYPIEHGIITNWEDMERIWHHVFFQELRVEPDTFPLVLTEAPLNPKSHRQKMAEIFFESFNVPYIFVGVQAVLSLYAAGRVTGTVVDSGDGVTHVVPIYEGYILPHAITRLNVAGRSLTIYMNRLLKASGHSFTSLSNLEVIREIKENVCYTALDYNEELAKYTPASNKEKDLEVAHKLPDGTEIFVDAERFQCPEALFNPKLIGLDSDGIHKMIYNSISECDFDVRKKLYGNIILSGGTTLFPNIQKRLEKELKKLINVQSINPNIDAPPERKFLVYLGAKILSNLPQFLNEVSVSRQEWDEYGASIVSSRFF